MLGVRHWFDTTRVVNYDACMKSKVMIAVALIVVVGSALRVWKTSSAPASPSNNTNSSSTTPPQAEQPAVFDKTTHSTTDPSSLWVVVNKKHPLSPASYAPNDLVIPKVAQRVPGNESMQLRHEAAAATEAMFGSAAQQNISLMISSGYRSYTYQVNLYASYVHKSGQAEADKISARPGHSEHQTGLAFDVEPASQNCEILPCFADTAEGKWIKAESYKYGFIIRYTPDKVDVTGYSSEPWHLRYVGIELATEMHNQNIRTLEEFFGITGGDSY